uniref:Uncharacterized protein n=1 Tax=Salmonella typhimurium TaxID=90371 RepID=A0A385JK50_SALTM|nr:hypothetical protein MH257753_0143 [Salmonella enterica subsp. enterica serovar Typhimurium]AXY98935.1 hypothetical protein pST1007-1B_LOC0166 [Salmonella enterica subsp. enterica serovar Typhimurium]AXY99082.1 hypothetical protein pST1007-1C_LOC0154 [Salmonella enterica subsp. enterica serovar Typhimurium]AXY99212.1 hypothetical protein pST1007-1D0137 [Salmonella enterica subsp. enterica serovar Typhimurium]
MHLPPQAAGPDQSYFSYNTQTEPPGKTPVPRRTEATKPSFITEKRRRPAQRAGTTSLLIMNVVTKHSHRCQSSGWKYRVHARKRPSRPANAEIRPDFG